MEEKREAQQQLQKYSSAATTTAAMANSVTFPDEIPSISSSFPLSSIFDTIPSSDQSEKNSLSSSSYGFMDLLGIQDYTPTLLDWLPATTAATTAVQIQCQQQQPLPSPSPASSNVPDSSEVLNTPTSPNNSSSISSSSNEAAATAAGSTDEQQSNKADDEDRDGGRGDDQDQDKTKKQ